MLVCYKRDRVITYVFCRYLLLNILCFLVFYKKISLNESEVWRKDISKQNYCHACHTRFAVFLPPPSCCVSSLLLHTACRAKLARDSLRADEKKPLV